MVLSSHDHVYERFAPQSPDGELDAERGIRQFTVGTGGGNLYEFEEIMENSELRWNGSWGVLELTLMQDSYAWHFHSTEPGRDDTGRGRCH